MTRSPTHPDLKPQWFQILLALADEPRHGLGIRDEVLRQTQGRMRLWPAMLYGSLRQLEDADLILETSLDGPGSDKDRRRFYSLTRAGEQALRKEATALAGYLSVAKSKKVLGRSRS